MIEWLREACESMGDGMGDAKHWLPFAALCARESVPANRPMATRLIEQAFVAALAGGGGTFATYSAMLKAQEVEQVKQGAQLQALKEFQAEQIKVLKDQVRDTEIRLTAQIVELRSRQLK